MDPIDQQLLRSVSRQLRAIKIMLSVFFVFFLAMLAILGFITYKVVTFTQQVNTKITNFENTTKQSLDIKSKVCDSKSLSSFLGSSSDLCK